MARDYYKNLQISENSTQNENDFPGHAVDQAKNAGRHAQLWGVDGGA